MPIPSDRMTAVLRMQSNKLLSGTCTVNRTTASNGSLSAVYSNLACLVVPDTSLQPAVGTEYPRSPVMYIIMVPAATLLKEKDQVTHGTTIYEVVEVYSDNTPLVYRQARMRRLKPATS